MDPRAIIFPGICTRRGREGEGGGEGMTEVFSSFCKKSPLYRLSHLKSREKILQAPLSLSYGSRPDITLFAEFLLLREVFYSYVISFSKNKARLKLGSR